MNNNNDRIIAVDLIRAAACIMIFLYHCNTILPGEWKFLTLFGDDMGNDLFFMVSGFALYPSVSAAKIKHFPRWYGRRLKKLLPLLVFFYLLSFLTGFYSFADPVQLFTVFIYPSLYWFVTAILFFYILLFFSDKLLPLPARTALSVLLLILWQLRPDTMEAYYFIGLSSMLLGFSLREFLEKTGSGKPCNMPALPLSLLFFAAYLILKILKLQGGLSPALHLLSGISVLLTGLTALYLGYVKNDQLTALKDKHPLPFSLAARVGSLALPVYLVQCFNAGILGYTLGIKYVFPLSFLINLIIVWGTAALLSKAFTIK